MAAAPANVNQNAAFGAPIKKSSDGRLCGGGVIAPFRGIYATWIRPLTNPCHSETNCWVEYGRRTVNAVAATVVLLVFLPLLLVCRVAQFIHYCILSEQERTSPKAVDYQGLKLPELKEDPRQYPHSHNTHLRDAIRKKRDQSVDVGSHPEITDDDITFQGPLQTVTQIEEGLRSGAILPKDDKGTFQIEWMHTEDLLQSEVAVLDLPSDQYEVSEELFRRNGFKAIHFSDGTTILLDPLFMVIRQVAKLSGLP